MPQFMASHTRCWTFCLHSCSSTPPATLSPSAAAVPLANSSGSNDNGRPLESSLNPEQRWKNKQTNTVYSSGHDLTSCLLVCVPPGRTATLKRWLCCPHIPGCRLQRGRSSSIRRRSERSGFPWWPSRRTASWSLWAAWTSCQSSREQVSPPLTSQSLASFSVWIHSPAVQSERSDSHFTPCLFEKPSDLSAVQDVESEVSSIFCSY